jgi:antitoxin VapB
LEVCDMPSAPNAKAPSTLAGVQKAKVFRNGRSQAVRIPAEFRFNTDEVFVRRDEQTGDLILSQRPQSPVDWDAIFKQLDEAGAADFELQRDLSPPPERDWP